MAQHGGKREGAGPKQKLDLLARLHVGARAENFAEKIARRKAFALHNAKMEELEISQAQRKAARKIRSRGAGWWETSLEAVDLRISVEAGLANLAGDDMMEDPPRIIHLRFPRYGQRAQVLRTVARWATWRYRTKITQRYVRDCWKSYNKFRTET